MAQTFKIISVRDLVRNFASVHNTNVDVFVVMRHGKPLGVYIPAKVKTKNFVETCLGTSDAAVQTVVKSVLKQNGKILDSLKGSD